MTREDKINYIIDNHPEAYGEYEDVVRDEIERGRKAMSDKDLDNEVEWVDYLGGK